MGPESNSGPMVAYLDGQPVEIGTPLPEITPDYSAGGVTAEVAAGLERFIYSLEFDLAINLALALKPELVHRYRRTKKKRIRKKYKKRIMVWFREVFR